MKNSEDENLILIGMSGAGKSTLGVLLAKARGMDFVDTDILIQQKEKRLLQEIIDTDGIGRFLEIEEEILLNFRAVHCVAATGGSAVYSERAMESLRAQGRIIYLSVPFAELEKRLSNITTRGIVMTPGKTLRDVYEERLPLYKKYSDLTVECGGRQIEDSVREILVQLSEK